MSSGDRIPYAEANKIAIGMLYDLINLTYIDKAIIVGSLRRKKEEVGDIDFQIEGDSYVIQRYMRKMNWQQESAGNRRHIYTRDKYMRNHYECKTEYELPETFKINFFLCNDYEWGAQLMHNTGSKKYNIRKRYIIKKKGWKLNQYGLYDDTGSNLYPKTEKDIYDIMEWDYCKPEDRI